ncbi:hypothetical protein CHU95_13775 [Niveispirillum lacus]|uniref:Uncharacterized protein n=1 Tax=Niveispirillum lacus TaxID=1981099 RepID=A0A255YXQ6_9PROT|nr:hypothetical protein CHU95_13775 [Niveispirillum lacus]
MAPDSVASVRMVVRPAQGRPPSGVVASVLLVRGMAVAMTVRVRVRVWLRVVVPIRVPVRAFRLVPLQERWPAPVYPFPESVLRVSAGWAGPAWGAAVGWVARE